MTFGLSKVYTGVSNEKIACQVSTPLFDKKHVQSHGFFFSFVNYSKKRVSKIVGTTPPKNRPKYDTAHNFFRFEYSSFRS